VASNQYRDTPTAELAACRRELIAQARRIPNQNLRLLRQDLAAAHTALQRAEQAHTNASQRHDTASSRRTRRSDPDAAELARRDLTNAATGGSTRLDLLGRQVAIIDTALAPRIAAAVRHPEPYLLDALGARTDTNAHRWDDAATVTEAYRHTTLGIEPHDGPFQGAANPAVGQRPNDSLAVQPWQDALDAAVEVQHTPTHRPLRIGR
jgi:hypothetical protein